MIVPVVQAPPPFHILLSDVLHVCFLFAIEWQAVGESRGRDDGGEREEVKDGRKGREDGGGGKGSVE